MTITLRNSKGSPLTYSELDDNFTTLDTRIRDGGWADLTSEVYTRSSPSSAEVTLFRNGLYLFEFDSIELRECFANYHIPHSWKQGTEFLPHVHFSPTTNSSGVIRWNFEYSWARRHDATGQTAYPATTTISLDFTINANNAYTHFVAEMPDGQGIDGSTLQVDALILMRIYRDPTHPNDTFPDSVWVQCVDLHHQIDRLATVSRAPPFYS